MGAFTKRDGGGQNHQPDTSADCRICIESPWIVCEPDHEGGNHDTDIVDRISNHVDEDSEDSEVAVRFLRPADAWVTVTNVSPGNLREIRKGQNQIAGPRDTILSAFPLLSSSVASGSCSCSGTSQ